MATMARLGLIRWHPIWGVACFRKKRAPQRKSKRRKGSAPAAGIPRRKPPAQQLLPDAQRRCASGLRAGRKRPVPQLLPAPPSLWGRKPRNSKTKLSPAG
jgi:hypothetical protein